MAAPFLPGRDPRETAVAALDPLAARLVSDYLRKPTVGRTAALTHPGSLMIGDTVLNPDRVARIRRGNEDRNATVPQNDLPTVRPLGGRQRSVLDLLGRGSGTIDPTRTGTDPDVVARIRRESSPRSFGALAERGRAALGEAIGAVPAVRERRASDRQDREAADYFRRTGVAPPGYDRVKGTIYRTDPEIGGGNALVGPSLGLPLLAQGLQQLADSSVNNPGGVYSAFTHPLRTGEQLAGGIRDTVTDPQDHVANAALLAFLAGSAGAGVATRGHAALGAAEEARRLGRNPLGPGEEGPRAPSPVRHALTRPGYQGGSLLRRPEPGTDPVVVPGGKPVAVEGPLERAQAGLEKIEGKIVENETIHRAAGIPVSTDVKGLVGARKRILDEKQSVPPELNLAIRLGRARARLIANRDAVTKQIEARTEREAELGIARGDVAEGPQPATTVNRLLSRNALVRNLVQRGVGPEGSKIGYATGRNRRIQRALFDENPPSPRNAVGKAWHSMFSAQSTMGREMRVEHRIEAAGLEAPVKQLTRAAHGILTRGLSRGEHAAVGVVGIEGVHALQDPAEVIARHIATHERHIAEGYSESSNRAHITDLNTALHALENPSPRLMRSIELTRRVAEETEARLIAAGHLTREVADARRAHMADIYRGGEHLPATPGKLGVSAPRDVAQARVNRLQKAWDFLEKKGQRGGYVVTERPKTVAEAEARLKEIEAELDALHENVRGKMFAEKQTPEDAKEQLDRNKANAEYDRQQAGLTRAGVKAQELDRQIHEQRATIERLQKEVSEAAKAKPAATGDDAERAAFVANAPRAARDSPTPTMKGLTSLLKERKGKPGITIENGHMRGLGVEDYPGSKIVVMRDENGNPIGILTMERSIKPGSESKTLGEITEDDFGPVDLIQVVVAPAHRRKGIATKLYDAAEKAGYDVAAASGKGGYTTEGAHLAYSRQKARPTASAERVSGEAGTYRITFKDKSTVVRLANSEADAVKSLTAAERKNVAGVKKTAYKPSGAGEAVENPVEKQLVAARAEVERLGPEPDLSYYDNLQAEIDRIEAAPFTPTMQHATKDAIYSDLVSSAARVIKWDKFASRRAALEDYLTRKRKLAIAKHARDLKKAKAKVSNLERSKAAGATTQLEIDLNAARARLAELNTERMAFKGKALKSGSRGHMVGYRKPLVSEEQSAAVDAEIERQLVAHKGEPWADALQAKIDEHAAIKFGLEPEFGEAAQATGSVSEVTLRREHKQIGRLGGALSHAKDDLEAAVRAADSRVEPTGFIGGEGSIPEGSFFTPQARRYTDPSRRGGRAGTKTRPGEFGTAPPNAGRNVPGLGKQFTGTSRKEGKVPVSVASATAHRAVAVDRLLMTENFYDRMWKVGTPERRTAYDVPFRATSEVQDELRTFFGKLADRIHASPDELAQLNREEFEALTNMIDARREYGRADVGSQIEGIRWVDQRYLMSNGETSVRGGLEKLADAFNLPVRGLQLYARPVYALNLAGNMGMLGVTSGFKTVPSMRRAVMATKEDGADNAALIDSYLGSSRSRSYAVETGPMHETNQRAAEAWNQLTDLYARRSSFYTEAERVTGAKTPQQIDRLLHDPRMKEKLNEVVRRANKNIVDYDSLTPVEKNTIRRIIYFYPWVSRGTLWALRTVVENPGKVFTLAQLGQIGADNAHKAFGDTPAWADQLGLIPVGKQDGGDGLQETINLSPINTYQTAASSVKAVIDTGRGLAGFAAKPGARGAADSATPFLSLAANVFGAQPSGNRRGGLPGVLESLPEYGALRRSGIAPSIFGETSKTFPDTGIGPAAGTFVGGGPFPRNVSTDELHRQAESEKPAPERAANRVKLERDTFASELKRLGIADTLPPWLTETYALQERRKVAYARLGGDATQADRLGADLDLAVSLGALGADQAKTIQGSLEARPALIPKYRRKLNEELFGGKKLELARKALRENGGDLK